MGFLGSASIWFNNPRNPPPKGTTTITITTYRLRTQSGELFVPPSPVLRPLPSPPPLSVPQRQVLTRSKESICELHPRLRCLLASAKLSVSSHRHPSISSSAQFDPYLLPQPPPIVPPLLTTKTTIRHLLSHPWQWGWIFRQET